tara:strand:+ start:1 stop:1248 length:1248 start_codon:yes stop_codon:yes gene_type:complete
MTPYLAEMGFESEIFENPKPGGQPILVARRHEGDDLPTLMTYGHGDVVRGYDDQWRDGIGPWEMKKEGERWYGRGTADNKGQHTINLAAMKACMDARGGTLGYNVVALIETGEETGSPGLREFCRDHKDLFKADVFIASDGPRLNAQRPTVYFGSRGVFNFTMSLDLRDGGHHSGNWGGLLANPGVILAHAISTIVDAKGKILLDDLKPEPISNSVRDALSKLTVGGMEGDPEIDPDWGEPGLTAEEKVFGWNTFEILAFKTGNPDNPVNAVPPKAFAKCHMRFVAGFDPAVVLPAVRKHLDALGYDKVTLTPDREFMAATRLEPDTPWAKWAINSLARTAGEEPAVLPNLGGSLPNDCFAHILGLPTVWVPHSYPACSQHAPNEHILEPVSRSALRLMGGLFWDLGERDGLPLQ